MEQNNFGKAIMIGLNPKSIEDISRKNCPRFFFNVSFTFFFHYDLRCISSRILFFFFIVFILSMVNGVFFKMIFF